MLSLKRRGTSGSFAPVKPSSCNARTNSEGIGRLAGIARTLCAEHTAHQDGWRPDSTSFTNA